MQLEGVIFDVDGTLAETERYGHRVAYNEAFKELGYPIEWDDALYARLLQIAGGRERVEFYLRERPDIGDVNDAELDAIHHHKSVAYAKIVKRGVITLKVGVRRLLDELRDAGVAVAIASTTTYEGLSALLEVTIGPDWSARFAALGLAEVAPRKKPDSGVYDWVVERLGSAPGALVAIEDSEIGLRAARGAGIPCLVTPSDFTHGEDFSSAQLVSDSLGDQEYPAQWRYPDGSSGKGIVNLALLESLL
ncbi:MAG: HAD family hydrolase [Ferrimicrobium sp.]